MFASYRWWLLETIISFLTNKYILSKGQIYSITDTHIKQKRECLIAINGGCWEGKRERSDRQVRQAVHTQKVIARSTALPSILCK